jgi:hypothetical protein
MREAVILTNLGESNYRQGKPQAAIAVLSEAERISSTLGDRILEAEILRGLAKAHLLLTDLPSARSYVARSVALFGRRSKPFLGVALRTLAESKNDAQDSLRRAGTRSASRSRSSRLGNDIGSRARAPFSGFLERTSQRRSRAARRAVRLRDRRARVHERLASRRSRSRRSRASRAAGVRGLLRSPEKGGADLTRSATVLEVYKRLEGGSFARGSSAAACAISSCASP